jgi:hypothetical protein
MELDESRVTVDGRSSDGWMKLGLTAGGAWSSKTLGGATKLCASERVGLFCWRASVAAVLAPLPLCLRVSRHVAPEVRAPSPRVSGVPAPEEGQQVAGQGEDVPPG